MRPHLTHSHSKVLAAGALVATVFACQPDRGPAGLAGPITASREANISTEALTSPGWQRTAAALVGLNKSAPCAAGRMYAFVGVAQYWAVQRAEHAQDRDGEDERGDRSGASDRGAVAGASVVVLGYLFPNQAQALEDSVTAQRSAGSDRAQRAFARGEAIGRAVGATIVTRAQTDGWATPFTGTVPVGPGFWHSEATPPSVACGQLPGVLAEIRGFSDTRTHAQDSIAAFWALGTGTPTASGFWLQVATDAIPQHDLSERRAAHVYALLSAAMADAAVGCWDVKETYWLIRPWQADPAIKVVAAVGKPNHPSYISGHSCVSSSAGAVLSSFFPEQRAQLDAMVTEAGLSRLYGGIHYRFDIEAGQLLGRSVARFAIAADRSGESVLAGDDGERGDGRR